MDGLQIKTRQALWQAGYNHPILSAAFLRLHCGGFVAERYGVKLVLVITLVSLLIGGILLGFCTNLVVAMGVRFIFFGLLAGWFYKVLVP